MWQVRLVRIVPSARPPEPESPGPLPIPISLGASKAPALAGKIHTITSDQSSPTDHPRWVQSARWLAVLTLVGVAIGVWAVARLLHFLLGRLRGAHKGGHGAGMLEGLVRGGRGSSHHHGSLRSLAAGAGLGYLGAQLLRRELIQVWRLDKLSGEGGATARIAISPSHVADVRVGDQVELWGRWHRDGTFRAYRAYIDRTSTTIRPNHISPVTLLGLSIAALIIVSVLAAAVH